MKIIESPLQLLGHQVKDFIFSFITPEDKGEEEIDWDEEFEDWEKRNRLCL